MSETDSAPLLDPGDKAANIPEFSVSEIAGALKRTVEGAFPYVRIRGEISGFRGAHSSGHAYFALKDEGAKIDAVCFRGVFSKVKAKVQEGLEVIATGRVTTYPGKSSYQIIVEQIEPAGAGALLALLEERRKKLAAEGLFDDEHKKPLPYLPTVIGVVTSPTGAVIRDILHRLRDRFPRTVLVWPVSVQGDKAASEVAAAIEGFNALKPGGKIPRPDILIVARGGGSIEDLWAFNEEVVVRAVFASTIPVISAVGHETDTTLIDFVSDRRAPTPTAAAEMAVPVRADLLRAILDHGQRLEIGRQRVFTGARQRLTDIARALPRRDRLLEGPRQRLDLVSSKLAGALTLLVQRQRARLERAGAGLTKGPLIQNARRHGEQVASLAHRMHLAAGRRTKDAGQRLAASAKLLETLSHKATLERGFAIVTGPDRRLINRRDGVSSGDELQIAFVDGAVAAIVAGTPSPQAKPKPKQKQPGQADLF
jgi:exodeoxyribonuclease VII large subunit